MPIKCLGLVLPHSQNRDGCRPAQEQIWGKNEAGRIVRSVQLTQKLCAFHGASLVYLFLHAVKSWQRQVMTQKGPNKSTVSEKASKTIPAYFDF